MSFDVYLDHVSHACEHCGREEERYVAYEFNLTHNVNEIVDRCLVAAGATRAKLPDGTLVPDGVKHTDDMSYCNRSWGRLQGWRAGDVAGIVRRASEVAHDPARSDEFHALEPKNGWGTLVVVREVLSAFANACTEYPDTTIRTSG